LQEHGSVAER